MSTQLDWEFIEKTFFPLVVQDARRAGFDTTGWAIRLGEHPERMFCRLDSAGTAATVYHRFTRPDEADRFFQGIRWTLARLPASAATRDGVEDNSTEPPEDDTKLVPVMELVAGDLIDLESDPYADPDHGTPGHLCEFGFALVPVGDDEDTAGEPGEPGTYRLFVQDLPGVYVFPADHAVKRSRSHTEPTRGEPAPGH